MYVANRICVVAAAEGSTSYVDAYYNILLSLMTITREQESDNSERKTGWRCDHVIVNDRTGGYGIFIENMLDAAG